MAIPGGRIVQSLFLGPAWTLGYEEQFYALSGLLLVISPRRYFSGAAMLSAGVAAFALAQVWWPVGVEGLFLNGLWLQFAGGVLVYYAVNYGGAAYRLLAGALLAGIVVAIAGLNPSALFEATKNEQQSYLAAALFALIALLTHRFDRQLTEVRWLEPLRLCGTMCYSLYLVHMPALTFMAAGLASTRMDLSPWVVSAILLTGCLALAAVFHMTCERRFMRPPPQRRSPGPILHGMPAEDRGASVLSP